jgi:hypothetical protein
MTPKEKAEELFDKMYMLDDPNGNHVVSFNIAKQCALVATEELINEVGYLDEFAKLFYEQVKHELEKL